MCHTGLRTVLVGWILWSPSTVAVGSVGCYTTQFLAVAYPKLAPRDVSVGGVDVRIRSHTWGGEGAGGGWDGKPGCKEAGEGELEFSKM